MGQDKATLPFGDELMLQRVVRILAQSVPSENIVVVAAADQVLPPLQAEVRVARDLVAFQGPLAGMSAGFHAFRPNSVDAAFVTSCDAPFLKPSFVERMFSLLGSHEVAVPVDQDRHYPLSAVYRPTILARIDSRVAGGQLRVRDLIDAVDAYRVPVEELRAVDAELRSLVNINNEDEYHAALALCSADAASGVDGDLL